MDWIMELHQSGFHCRVRLWIDAFKLTRSQGVIGRKHAALKRVLTAKAAPPALAGWRGFELEGTALSVP